MLVGKLGNNGKVRYEMIKFDVRPPRDHQSTNGLNRAV